MTIQVLESKLVPEDVNISFDFLSRLKIGETVGTAACVMSVLSGIDANPAAMLSGLPSISGSIVSQKVIDGLPGVTYILSISIRTSLNNVYVTEGKLSVLSSNAATPA
jgi:hypothetical protein